MTLLSDVIAPEYEAEATKSFMEAKEKQESDKEKAKADKARAKAAAKAAMDLKNNSKTRRAALRAFSKALMTTWTMGT